MKNAEIKYKRHIHKQKELLNLFNDLLDTILTDKTLESKSQKDDENEHKNGNENKNVETLMSSNKDDYDEIVMSSDEDDDETMSQNKMIKKLNDYFDEIIDKSKSFENQIKSLEKVKGLDEYWHSSGYGDKKLEFKIFKIKLAEMSKIIEKKLFEQIFGYTLEKLANKLIIQQTKKKIK